MKKLEKTIKEFAQELLKKLGIDASVAVASENDAIAVTVTGDNIAILIGRYGETLQSLSHILSLVATKQAGTFTRVAVDADNWRKNHEEKLVQMAKRAIERVLDTGKDYEFPPMNPSERRVIHSFISENVEVKTESVGEGKDRHVVVRLA